MLLTSMVLAMNPAAATPPRRSALGLLVLTQLMSEPMHVYRMQKMFEYTGKNRVVNVRSRASLYQTLDRLLRHGLVEVTETVKVEGYPDRVVYGVTDAGRTVARQWLREALHTTDDEYPEFITAVSLMFVLPPEETLAELELRAENLNTALTETRSSLAAVPDGLPRLFLLEEEYRQAVLEAELAWLSGVIDDLRAGRLSWSEEWLREVTAAFIPQTDNDNQEEA